MLWAIQKQIFEERKDAITQNNQKVMDKKKALLGVKKRRLDVSCAN